MLIARLSAIVAKMGCFDCLHIWHEGCDRGMCLLVRSTCTQQQHSIVGRGLLVPSLYLKRSATWLHGFGAGKGLTGLGVELAGHVLVGLAAGRMAKLDEAWYCNITLTFKRIAGTREGECRGPVAVLLVASIAGVHRCCI
jgi:hypothetical protein